MQAELVTSGDAEKLSAGVAKDAIKDTMSKRLWQCPFINYTQMCQSEQCAQKN